MRAAGCAIVAAIAGGAGPALAGGQATQLSFTGDALVRDAAGLSELHLDYLLNDPTRRGAAPQLGSRRMSASSASCSRRGRNSA